MVTKVFNIALDIKKAVDNDKFTIVEGDTGNYVHITLTDSGTPVPLSGCRVLAVFSKTNGTSMQDSAEADGGVTIDTERTNEITIHLFPSSFALGLVECEIQVYSGPNNEVLVTTAKFNFDCRLGIFNAGTAQATNEYPLLVGLINRVGVLEETYTDNEAARAEAEGARADAETARARAEQDRAEAEQGRADAEDARANAERDRAAAEQGRAEAEQGRQDEFTSVRDAANAAAERAEAAAEAAGSAIGDMSVLLKTAALPVSGWVSSGGAFIQSASVPGLEPAHTVIVSPAPESFYECGEAGIYCTGQSAGSLSFACGRLPDEDISVIVLIFTDSSGSTAGGTGGTSDHSLLINRDLPDQHPMSAITGLNSELTQRPKTAAMTAQEIDNILV